MGEHYANAGIDEGLVASIYADDVILDFPQSGERIHGRDNILAFRLAYPVQLRIEIRRTTGCGDVWVNEGTIRYEGQPQRVVSIWEFENDRLAHETIYVTELWDAPEWRAQWAGRMPDIDGSAG